MTPDRARRAAALLTVVPVADRAHLVATVRSGALERHAGQVSLPGGVVEPGETFEQAALREAHEEVAMPLARLRLMGALTPIDIPVSGFRLHPVVAALEEHPRLRPADSEVAEILEVPIAQLLERDTLVSIELARDGYTLVAPAYRIGNHHIWGATAMVLAEFLEMLGREPEQAAGNE
jgi:8-oxo-dGTP pyrophosphatase MutT (NUDIX family)